MKTESPDTEDCSYLYDRWFRARVQAALDDPSPGIPHEQVMREMNALLAAKCPKQQVD
ncbi:type II toxin-antitoxin system RelB family antitoxin [Pseudomonas sp. GXZC]|uniref:type II toxin-antitoxin system RelB family antitoxin n=1 Tax=Pseudomonas sp. GXZC TaxID=3003351 RepID=UPI0022AAD118|nr:antitoxin [Pseudomonas sp. GXZC]WAT29974.1 antitoxin [Pseudomonas sp. GXZC]